MNVDDLLGITADKKKKNTKPKKQDNKKDQSFNDVMGAISHNWESDNQVINTLQEEIKNLKSIIQKKDHEILKLKKSNNSYSENDILLVAQNKDLQKALTVRTFKAIKSEKEIQDSDLVKISRDDFTLKYGVQSPKIKPHLEILESFGFIEVVWLDKKQRRFKILKDLPEIL